MIGVSPPIASGGRAIYPAITELADIPRWVCWKLQHVEGRPKPTKVPYTIGGRRKASSTDPRTWDTFDACWRSAFHDGTADGIGLVVDGSDDLMAADLDDCIHDSGIVMPWARIVVRKLSSYTERSPSGRGLRIFYRSPHGALDWGLDEKGEPKQGRSIKFQGGHLELYRGKRFLTVTGAHYEEAPHTINAVPPEVLGELLVPAKGNGADHSTAEAAAEISDELRERLEEAMAEDTRLWEAWNGQRPEGADQTRSAFDLRLAGALRRFGGFTLQDFATLARWWPHGKGGDGDARHWRRTWERAQPADSSTSAGKPWGEPEPLVAEHHRPAPYPVDALPPIIRDAVLSYQTFGQQPVELVACSALGAASLVCQALADVDRDGGNLTGPSSLSFVIVAKSGERKSAADRRMRRALIAWERGAREEQAPQIKAARRRHAAWQAKLDGITGRIKRIAYSTKTDHEIEVQQLESRLLALEQDEPEVPPEIALFHEETSPEQLAILLATGWPSSSLWSDEAGLVIGSHAMSEGVAMRFLGLLNRLWDGGDFKRERVTRESVHIRGRRFTASLMMQPHVLAALLATGDGVARGIGALARYLIAWPDSTIGTRPYADGDLQSPELSAYDARIRALLATPLPLKDGCLEPPLLSLSRSAFNVWREFYNDTERELGRRGEFADVDDFGAKIAEQASRLACVLHVFQRGPAGEIGEAAILAGAKIALWHLHETRRALARLARYSETADAEMLLGWLQSLDKPPTLGDVLRLGPYRLRDKKCRDAAVAMLAEHNPARLEPRGNNAHQIILNPALAQPGAQP